jgi:hypothetical protein
MFVACDAAVRMFVISFSWDSGGRLCSSRPLMELSSRRMRSVGNFRGFDSKASVDQCPY